MERGGLEGKEWGSFQEDCGRNEQDSVSAFYVCGLRYPMFFCDSGQSLGFVEIPKPTISQTYKPLPPTNPLEDVSSIPRPTIHNLVLIPLFPNFFPQAVNFPSLSFVLANNSCSSYLLCSSLNILPPRSLFFLLISVRRGWLIHSDLTGGRRK